MLPEFYKNIPYHQIKGNNNSFLGIKRAMHIKNGWFIDKLENNVVRIRKYIGKNDGTSIESEVLIFRDEFISAVAEVALKNSDNVVELVRLLDSEEQVIVVEEDSEESEEEPKVST